MRTIKAEPITCEAYAPYGTFYSMTGPSGYSLNGEIHRFFPDRMDRSLMCPERHFPRSVKETGCNEDHPGGVSHDHAGDDPSAQ